MTYQKRVPLLMLLDSVIVMLSIYAGYYILHPYSNFYNSKLLLVSSLVLLASHHIFALRYRLYLKAWEYASVGEMIIIAKAVTFSIATTGLVQLIGAGHVHIRVLLMTWMLHMLLIGGSRFSWRMYRDRFMQPTCKKKQTLIVGAGSGGATLARQLIYSNDVDLMPVAFVDDDPRKYMLEMYGIKVCGGIDDIPALVERMKIEHIIIAIPSLSRRKARRIYEVCSQTEAEIKIMPLLEDVMTGKVEVSALRNVEVEDLLGRDTVELDISTISQSITGETVLVTGAGGSIGSEICRQLCKFHPKKMILLGHGEYSIYKIDMELRKEYSEHIELVPVIADVQDPQRMQEVIGEHKPRVIYHAAAHKHVPLMEGNPREAVKNNIFGTKNVAEAADIHGVDTFVLISTDKAVNPPNVMGATKRIAEMIIQTMAKESETKFVAVRFGNVLGSRGSVIPLFKKQIEVGGPVTVTHPDMTRYFMTIPEASRLVIQAGTLARGGEVFVLDMGEPVKISDLAKNLITLSGYSLDEIEIEYTGIRPGEKMFEELLNENEVQEEQVFPKIHVGKADPIDKQDLYGVIERLKEMSIDEMKGTLVTMANRKRTRELQVAR
ncbi:polysaccharide biosynthesis protein [Siminovitchia acidinfaciens]|uniref:Polysaccharide biosynthesis protein n=1 Tax=Siminovitchia acidinfaciens TaxID=2321395 RepID=A0A429XZI9_9BACI|nr:nucleoside-diphosphate sugar epimerase/dehydratase [Siminovitchia acidinfaciens]RST74192.1 polysaccharide biosynthesis protein [Siminovitchia acidinfaciens]